MSKKRFLTRGHATPPPLKDVEKSSQKRRLPMLPQTANRDSTGVLCTLIANTRSLFLDF